MLLTRDPPGPTQAPMGSTLGSADQTAILVAAARLPGDGLDLHGAVVDFGNLQLKEALDQSGVGPGQEDLGAPGWTGGPPPHRPSAGPPSRMTSPRTCSPGARKPSVYSLLELMRRLAAPFRGVDPRDHAGENLVLLGAETSS